MSKQMTITGFGRVTAKQTIAEVRLLAIEMQNAYRSGNIDLAIGFMQSAKPFVNALKNAGYKIEEIFGDE